MRGTHLFLVFPLVAGCGGNGETEHHEHHEHHEGGEHGEHHHGEHGEGGDHHADMPPALRAFHDRFAPIWHSEAGEERSARACEELAELHQLGEAAAAEVGGTPADNLRSGFDALEHECTEQTTGMSEPGAIDQALTTIHDALHEALEASGAH